MQTDRAALQHLLKQPRLSSRQIRLLETLQEFDFDIEYWPGAKNYIQDALSRRPDYKDPQSHARVGSCCCKPRRSTQCRPRVSRRKDGSTSSERPMRRMTTSGWYGKPLSPAAAMKAGADLEKGESTESFGRHRQRITGTKNYEMRDGLIFHKSSGRLALPKPMRRRAMAEAHDSAVGRHFDTLRTIILVSKSFCWKGLAHDAKR